jgi:hypothetical protein
VVGLYSSHEVTLSADRQVRAQSHAQGAKGKKILSFVLFFLAFLAPLRDD